MFAAKTSHSGKLKALFEVLFSNSQTVCITVSKTGISSETSTSNSSIICVNLPAERFEEYEFTFDEPLYIGLGSPAIPFFKSLKNKMMVELSMKNPFTLDIITTPLKTAASDDCRVEYSISVFSAQNIASSPGFDYVSKPIDISCANFNTMCKSFSKSSAVDVTGIDISKRNSQLSFSFELTGISKKTLQFGKYSAEDSSLYYNQFKVDAIVRIVKITSFGKDYIRMTAEDDKPLLIETESPLGSIKVFLSNEI